MNTQFKKWSDSEQSQLLSEVAEGLPIYAIAKAHDRSKKAIELRLLDMSIRMLGDGCTYDEIFAKTKCTEEQINNRIKQAQEERALKDKSAPNNPLNSSQIPFRQIETPDRSLLESILAEIRDLKMMIANTMTN
jgi:hypothetical protein